MAGIKTLLQKEFTGLYRVQLVPEYHNQHKPDNIAGQTITISDSDNLRHALDILQTSGFRTLAAIRGETTETVYMVKGYTLEVLLLKDCKGNDVGTVQGVYPIIGTRFIIKPHTQPLPGSKKIPGGMTASEKTLAAKEARHEAGRHVW